MMVVTYGESARLGSINLFWKAGRQQSHSGPSCGTGAAIASAGRCCQWHLRKNAKLALMKAGMTRPKDPMRGRADGGFRGPQVSRVAPASG